MIRYCTIVIVSILVMSCGSGSKTYHFDSVGWTIEVPAKLEVRDSLALNPPGVTNSFAEKSLIEVRGKGEWILGGAYLIASIKEISEDSQSWADKLRLMRSERVEGYTKDFLPEATIDSAYSTETVDGKVFDKTYYKVQRSGKAEYLEIYSCIINGCEYHFPSTTSIPFSWVVS